MTPYLANAILIGGARVKWEDFAVLNAQWNDDAIDARLKHGLINGLDDLAATLQDLPRIEDFEGRYYAARPWAIPQKQTAAQG